jgi:hypothetical protein
MMSNQLVEGFFLLSFWAPPLAVLAGALLLLAPNPPERQSHARAHAAPLTH